MITAKEAREMPSSKHLVIDANLEIVSLQITAVAQRGKTTTYIYGENYEYWDETCQKLVELGYKVEPDRYGAQVSWGEENDQ